MQVRRRDRFPQAMDNHPRVTYTWMDYTTVWFSFFTSGCAIGIVFMKSACDFLFNMMMSMLNRTPLPSIVMFFVHICKVSLAYNSQLQELLAEVAVKESMEEMEFKSPVKVSETISPSTSEIASISENLSSNQTELEPKKPKVHCLYDISLLPEDWPYVLEAFSHHLKKRRTRRNAAPTDPVIEELGDILCAEIDEELSILNKKDEELDESLCTCNLKTENGGQKDEGRSENDKEAESQSEIQLNDGQNDEFRSENDKEAETPSKVQFHDGQNDEAETPSKIQFHEGAGVAEKPHEGKNLSPGKSMEQCNGEAS